MNGRITQTLIGAVLVLSVVVQLFLPYTPYEAMPWWHSVPGTHALFGFLFTLLLVALAKMLGAAISHKDED